MIHTFTFKHGQYSVMANINDVAGEDSELSIKWQQIGWKNFRYTTIQRSMIYKGMRCYWKTVPNLKRVTRRSNPLDKNLLDEIYDHAVHIMERHDIHPLLDVAHMAKVHLPPAYIEPTRAALLIIATKMGLEHLNETIGSILD